MSKKHKKVYRALNFFELFLNFISAVSECVSIFTFASLVGGVVGIASSAVGLKIYKITAGIRMYRSVIKKKKKTRSYCVIIKNYRTFNF